MSLFQTESPFGDGSRSTSKVCDQLRRSKTTQIIPNVFIVDEDQAARDPLTALIAREGWRPVAFASGEEFLAYPIELAPGCMIIDVSLPGPSGAELQRRSATKCCHIPIIVLSARSDAHTIVEAMKSGAVEFLTKPFRDEELLKAIREALEKSYLATGQEMQKLALQKRYSSLSLRERQVMVGVSFGLPNKLVGTELGISEITVKAHRSQVMRKMQADSLADLVRMAGRLGLTKARDRAMFRDNTSRAGDPGGQLIGSVASAA